MTEQTYSLGEIAPILARANPWADVPLLQRQVRHWTVHNLLQPTKKHTGRGRERRYTAHQIRKAAVYVELTRFGMTVGGLAGIGDWLDMNEADEHGVIWAAAKEGQFRIYLTATWIEGGQQSSFLVHDDDWRAARRKWGPQYRKLVVPVSWSFGDGVKKIWAGSQGRLYVNLTELFKLIDV